MPLSPGTLLNNRYRIVSILGQGGMGAVYRALDEHLNVPVAVKENLFLTDEYARQFRREAHILAGLRHSNLPHVTDYFSFEHHGQYLVMDYIEGEDLRQRMERLGNLPEREVILVGISICEALTYLHTRVPAIVHRDIKPGNIKVTPDGQAVLVDFGLAKIMQGSQATSTGARAMTPGYSPPEQYGTARTDPRSDVYSLGATLYAAITGLIPEDGLARMTGKAELTPIRDLVPRINRRLASTIEKALEVDPEKRFQTAAEFRRALVEAGELNPIFQERPTIAPPPAAVLEQPAEPALAEPPPAAREDILSRPVSSSRKRKRRQRIMAYVGIPLAASLLAVVLLFAFNPGLFSPRPVAMLDASASTLQTQTSAASPADTPVPLQATSTPTPGPSPQPTGDETGSSTPQPADAPAEPSATPTVSPTPSATPLGGSEQIAFASDRSGVMQIWIMNADGSQQKQLTGVSGGACQPSWSPDGKQIAFTSPCPKRQDIYENSGISILNIETGEITDLPNSPEGDFEPAWSPDGKQIAFTSLRTGKPTIFAIDLATQKVRQISLTSRFSDRHPSWAPSGLQLVYMRLFSSWQIWYVTSDGLTHNEFSRSGNLNNMWPAWSPDGQVIYYSQTSFDVSIPWLMGRRYEDRATTKEFRIPSKNAGDPGPVAEVDPSPDNNWLAYLSFPDGKNFDIYIMKTNGSGSVRLTTDPGVDFGPAWRPAPVQP